MTQTPTARLRDTTLSPSDRNWAMWTHLSPLLAFMVLGPFAVVAPLALWLIRREQSPYVDDQGREVLNMSITGALLLVVCMMLGPLMLLWVIWAVVALVNVVRGAVAASNAEYFRYPMTIRFVS